MARRTPKIDFRATLSRPAEGGSWTFLRLPQEASDRLPTRSQITVEGTLNGIDFQACLQPDSEGGHWFRVEPELSGEAGASAGAVVEIEMTPTAVEPEPQVPDDLCEALAASPAAFAVWSSTTPLARRDWIQWLTSGKKAETRQIRMTKMMDMLAKGKRRICCFDRSGMASKGFVCPTAAEE